MSNAKDLPEHIILENGYVLTRANRPGLSLSARSTRALHYKLERLMDTVPEVWVSIDSHHKATFDFAVNVDMKMTSPDASPRWQWMGHTSLDYDEFQDGTLWRWLVARFQHRGVDLTGDMDAAH